jgi:hypothetical protein
VKERKRQKKKEGQRKKKAGGISYSITQKQLKQEIKMEK